MLLLKLKKISLLSTVFILSLFSFTSLAQSPFQFGGISISDEEAAGQLLMIGIPDKKIGPENQSLLKKVPAGSIILFKRNIGSLASLTEFTGALQSTRPAHLPFIIGIDQEGGDVVRLQTKPALPSAFSVSESKSIPFVSVFSDRLSELLFASGINMNFAPVLDLANPEEKSFLGSRSFGINPQWVSQVGYAYSRQHILNYVVPVAKHFPGIGNATVDPHSDVGVISKDLTRLASEDILPFQSFAKLGRYTGVMLSHFVYSGLDSKNPASLSPAVVQYLRGKLNYQGLIITDDLQMDAVKTNTSLENAALQSLKAGSDIVMVAYSEKSQERVYQKVLAAIQSGDLERSLVQEKLQRISFVKSLISRGLSQNLSLKVSLSDFYDLDEKLLDLKISKQKRKVSSAEDQKLCLLSNHKAFNQSFLSTARSAVKDFSTQISHKLSPRLIAELQKCDRLIVTVFNERSKAMVSQLPQGLLNSAYIVNLGLPQLTVALSQYAVIQLDFPHQLAGKKIAQLIN